VRVPTDAAIGPATLTLTFFDHKDFPIRPYQSQIQVVGAQQSANPRPK
jgi:hypothetical protein